MNPTLPECSKCGQPVPLETLGASTATACPHCQSKLEISVFPAMFRRIEPGRVGETIVVEGESSCFFHPQKKAVVPCDACGRFLCALCDCELHGQHFCPSCLETGKQKGKIEKLADVRFIYRRQALLMAFVPLFITGLAAIYMSLRYRNAPDSVVKPGRWGMKIALVVGILQTLGFALLFYQAFTS